MRPEWSGGRRSTLQGRARPRAGTGAGGRAHVVSLFPGRRQAERLLTRMWRSPAPAGLLGFPGRTGQQAGPSSMPGPSSTTCVGGVARPHPRKRTPGPEAPAETSSLTHPPSTPSERLSRTFHILSIYSADGITQTWSVASKRPFRGGTNAPRGVGLTALGPARASSPLLPGAATFPAHGTHCEASACSHLTAVYPQDNGRASTV